MLGKRWKSIIVFIMMFAFGLIAYWNGEADEEETIKTEEKRFDVEPSIKIIEASEGETDDYFYRPDGTMLYFYYECNYGQNRLPETFIDYCIEAVKEDCLIEKLTEISTEFEIVETREKETFQRERDNECGLAAYNTDYSLCKDIWYRVSLSPEGDDIIVEHVDEEGYIVNYFFWNIMRSYQYSDVPVRSGGQKQSRPYFIQWEDKNYMAIPYWSTEKDKIVGVAVYEFINNFGGVVTGIGINSDGTINISEQAYFAPSNWTDYVPDVVRVWPEVVKY